MPTDPPSNENQLPEADEYNLSAKLSKFKRELLLIDEHLGSQDDDLADRLRTFVTFPFIEQICKIFRRLALDSKDHITKEEKSVIAAVEEQEWNGEPSDLNSLYSMLDSLDGDKSLRFRNECFRIAKKSGQIPLFVRIQLSVAFGLASQGRYSLFLSFPKQPGRNDLARSAVETRNNIVHPPLQAVAPDYAGYAAVETLRRWFLSSLNVMLDCPERRAAFRSSKRPGEIVKGVVKEIIAEGVLVDLDGMNGLLRTNDVKGAGISQPKKDVFQLWQEIEVIILDINMDKKCVSVDLEPKLKKVFEAFSKGVPIEGEVVGFVDGGLFVDIGLEAFVPLEQIDIITPNDLSPFVGKKYNFQVVRPNDYCGKVILSRRAIIERERSKRWNEFMESKKPGDPVKVVVRDIDQSRALVDLEGMEGLLHISQISEKCVENLQVDQEIEASVMKVKRGMRVIDISSKAANYSVGLDDRAAAGEALIREFRKLHQNPE